MCGSGKGRVYLINYDVLSKCITMLSVWEGGHHCCKVVIIVLDIYYHHIEPLCWVNWSRETWNRVFLRISAFIIFNALMPEQSDRHFVDDTDPMLTKIIGIALKRKSCHLTKFSSLAALEVVKMTTSSAASDENFIKMMTFPFQWVWRVTRVCRKLIGGIRSTLQLRSIYVCIYSSQTSVHFKWN